ncbi:maltase-glucoamylase-like [Ptychodera flava]|uniref:maltase-glucoamylase-like n=1 Tax=Ptychodera flava TaxID=63121 RepID=UPI00396A7348
MATNTMYDVEFIENPFSLKITRKDTGAVLWDTSVGGFVFADQYLQISTRLPTSNFYGLGEHEHASFRHDMNYQTWGAFSRDQPPSYKANLYGVHPFYTCLEADTKSHGVLLLNSNAMDFTVQPTPALTYRTIGGVLDFYMFLGPSPENVVQQYTEAIGRPYMPPYWALGFQLCRYGYNSLARVKEVVAGMREHDIPHDVQYGDIDYMERQLDFTYDKDGVYEGLPDFVRQLQAEGTHYIIILDPAISKAEVPGTYPPYDIGTEEKVFIMVDKNGEEEELVGKVWPDPPNIEDIMKEIDCSKEENSWDCGVEHYRAPVVFPDFQNPKTQEWWINLTVDFHDEIPFDGIWIDMNEPASFVKGSLEGCDYNNKLESPPYKPKIWGDVLADKTICMVGKTHRTATEVTTQYNMHSLFGWSQTEPTLIAARKVTGERSMVVTRSTFPSTGKDSGHWLGDNASVWPHMHKSIIGMLEFNLFGFPYIGADICGFFENTTEPLCRRWTQLGAFYPYCRNHNGINYRPQDPPAFGAKFAEETRYILHVRYTLLPYLYTLFHYAHAEGNTVVRPVMHEFIEDSVTYDVDKQFLWGAALMISPVMEEDMEEVDIYFPDCRWYDYYTGVERSQSDRGKKVKVNAPNDYIPLHVRGGYIIPTQKPANSTVFSRLLPFGLIVALDDNHEASGSLFWDDGDSVDTFENGLYYLAKYTATEGRLESEIQSNNDVVNELIMDTVLVYGLDSVTDVTYNGQLESWNFNDMTKILKFGPSGPLVSYTPTPTREIYKPSSKASCIDSPAEPVVSTQPPPVPAPTTRPPQRTADHDRFDCFPDGKYNEFSEQKCLDRGCLYEESPTPSVPWCFFPPDYGSYKIVGEVQSMPWGHRIQLEKLDRPSMFGADISRVTLDVEFQTQSRIRFKFYDSDNARFEVPFPMPTTDTMATDTLYDITFNNDPFWMKVIRKSSGVVLWDTSVGGFNFADQFLQISSLLPTSNIYGLGETVHFSFRHDMNWRTWPIFTKDEFPGTAYRTEANLYGHHPFYTCMEEEYMSHGVFLLNANAMDVTLQPTPAITYRTIGGVLDFFMFLGPSPENVVQQYTEFIGRPFLPPYWALGFQLCRWGYNNLTNVMKVVDSMEEYDIPQDIQYGDIDYMERQMIFTIDQETYAGLPEFVRDLKTRGKHYVIILDPAVTMNETRGEYPPYDDGHEKDIFIKEADGVTEFQGRVWPYYKNVTVNDSVPWEYKVENYNAHAVFPDFRHPKAEEWWTDLIVDFHNTLEFDGIWIDMNEPANFVHGSLDGTCPDNNFNKPPYFPNLVAPFIYNKTLCMETKQYRDPVEGSSLTEHYNMHSLYGWSQNDPTLRAARKALPGKRSFVISRSTFPGSGKTAGHWLGDNDSQWNHMADSVIGMLEFGLFGFPYIGSDICGFFQNVKEDLCNRWMQIGAFYPFCRNHNAYGWEDQHPPKFGKTFAENSRKYLHIRYRLLPFLYTLFHEANTYGSTVVRPLMHENKVNGPFQPIMVSRKSYAYKYLSTDTATFAIKTQFLWGPALLISPVLVKDAVQVDAYFPDARWFDYYTGEEMEASSRGKTVRLDAPYDYIPLHVRGGYILPTQQPANSTVYSRVLPFGLIAALDDDGMATGSLFWDDGDSIDTYESGDYFLANFNCKENELGSVIRQNHDVIDGLYMDDITIYGIRQTTITSVYSYTDKLEDTQWNFNSDTKVLELNNLHHNMRQQIRITWE